MDEIEAARNRGEDRGRKVAEIIVIAEVRTTILMALNKHDGFVTDAAKELGVTSRDLVKLIKEYDLVAKWEQRRAKK